YAGSAGVPLLCLDENHAVGGAGTVDRGSGGILEDRDRLDVRRVEHVERIARKRRITADTEPAGLDLIAGDCHAVDYIERLIAGADRGSATNHNVRACAWLTAVLGDLNARRAAFDHVGDVGRHGDL